MDGRDSGPPWRGSGQDAVAESVGSPSAWGHSIMPTAFPPHPQGPGPPPGHKSIRDPVVCSPCDLPSLLVELHSWEAAPEGHLSLHEALLTQISVS